jgi:hypothetical protein
MDTLTRLSRRTWSARAAVALIAMTLSAAIGRATGTAERLGDSEDNIQAAPHVRTFDSKLNALMTEAARRSPFFRTLVGRLNRSNVFVYVETRLLPGHLSGRLTFIGGGQPWRYLRVEIECRQSTVDQVAALGHELQHAVEIADRTAAIDPISIRALYRTIGFAVDDSGRRFESEGARAAGNRVRKDWFSSPIGTAGAGDGASTR